MFFVCNEGFLATEKIKHALYVNCVNCRQQMLDNSITMQHGFFIENANRRGERVAVFPFYKHPVQN